MPDSLIATYRIQLNKDFTLYDTIDIVPYLKSLGVSHIYLSPIFESTKDSVHGYDVCDFTKISRERGGEEAFAELDALCVSADLRILLDIVPNHMGIAGDNPFWIDVLSKGRDSPYWSLFDLRVNPQGKIHLPILDKSLEETLAKGDAVIGEHEKYGRVVRMGQRMLPMAEAGSENKHYEPVKWTEAFDKISYRRFFDITDLIGVRVEDPKIFDLSHAYLFELCKKYPSIAGVRVDHVDGLADPTTYLKTLRNNIDDIWVEKILTGEETLSPDWPIQGTTGYEFIAHLNNLFVNANGFKTLQSYWKNHIDSQYNDFDDCVYKGKEQVLESLFSSELKRLTKLSQNIGTDQQAEIFWKGMTLCFDAYRTYAGDKPLSDIDRERIEYAALKAKNRMGECFEKAAEIFLPILLNPQTDIQKQLVTEWQQLSGPAMAKGLEDCAHYRYNPLTALNEVGCEPQITENSIDSYFEWARKIAKTHPYCLLATSTHDTKRSEDTRARLYTLADIPQEWIAFYEQAVRLNATFKKNMTIRPATEYFLYQSIIGIWPFDSNIEDGFIDRISTYMKKSAKEARIETSWLKPNQQYEDHLDEFIRAILKNEFFLSHVQNFVKRVEREGCLNSLAVLTLKVLGPAVPDFYQGCDKWDFSLVDPDNRRHVSYESKADLLSVPVRSDWKSGEYKKWYTRRLLNIRQRFAKMPLKIRALNVIDGVDDHIIVYQWQSLIVVCPRYNARITTDDVNTVLKIEEGQYQNLMTHEVYSINQPILLKTLLSESPIAILQKQSA